MIEYLNEIETELETILNSLLGTLAQGFDWWKKWSIFFFHLYKEIQIHGAGILEICISYI